MIKLYTSGANYIELPQTKKMELGGTQVYTETAMVSGKLVRDIVGFRPTIKLTFEYLPANVIVGLHNLARACSYFYVEYDDIDGTSGNGYFSISSPTSTVFKFIDGVPMWQDATVTLTAQEVI